MVETVSPAANGTMELQKSYPPSQPSRYPSAPRMIMLIRGSAGKPADTRADSADKEMSEHYSILPPALASRTKFIALVHRMNFHLNFAATAHSKARRR